MWRILHLSNDGSWRNIIVRAAKGQQYQQNITILVWNDVSWWSIASLTSAEFETKVHRVMLREDSETTRPPPWTSKQGKKQLMKQMMAAKSDWSLGSRCPRSCHQLGSSSKWLSLNCGYRGTEQSCCHPGWNHFHWFQHHEARRLWLQCWVQCYFQWRWWCSEQELCSTELRWLQF